MALNAALTVFFIVFGGGFRSRLHEAPLLTLSTTELLLGHLVVSLPRHCLWTALPPRQGTAPRAAVPRVDYNADHLLSGMSPL